MQKWIVENLIELIEDHVLWPNHVIGNNHLTISIIVVQIELKQPADVSPPFKARKLIHISTHHSHLMSLLNWIIKIISIIVFN